MKAYVLMKVRTGEITGVVRQLHRVKAVKTAEMTFGEFDAIAIVEAGDLEAMGTVIAAQRPGGRMKRKSAMSISAARRTTGT